MKISLANGASISTLAGRADAITETIIDSCKGGKYGINTATLYEAVYPIVLAKILEE